LGRHHDKIHLHLGHREVRENRGENHAPPRLVIAQWKQYCASDNCEPANPVIAVRYQSGELSVNVQCKQAKEILFRTTEEARNRWLDFRFHIRFSRTGRGRTAQPMTVYIDEYEKWLLSENDF
jgi:hypothetical protein